MLKRIVIMGASSGIGMELARIYIARGYRVGLAARRRILLEQLKTLAPERVEIAEIDVTDTDAPKRLEDLTSRLGGMDIYLHSSGVGWQNTPLDPTIELKITSVNVEGFTRCIDWAFGFFSNHGSGHLVAISSIAGTRGLGASPAYSASKAYQASYLQALRQLIAIRHLDNLYITDIRPGFVRTALLSGTNYPLLMEADATARKIARAIDCQKTMRIIDWRYRLIVGLWRLIPRPLWERLSLS
ncbi:MAG: SDR family NAD(P)-dependent oxidoreductase [Porphyromonadaceae bacterium]|nr:SDR family NAD(P)-dependent oxidoreductase [Porphyromonadaceae bacterium]